MLSDAQAITGIRPNGIRAEVRSDLPAYVPMRYDGDTGIIEVNGRLPLRRQDAAYFMAEELYHALDVLPNGNSIAASSERLRPNGDIWNEAIAASNGDSIIKNYLDYPLDGTIHGNLSDVRRAAELFARLGVLYNGNSEAFRRSFPNAWRLYDGLARALEQGNAGLRVKGRTDSDGRPQMGARDGQDADADRGSRGGRSQRTADYGLGGIRQFLADELQGDRLGRHIPPPLETRETEGGVEMFSLRDRTVFSRYAALGANPIGIAEAAQDIPAIIGFESPFSIVAKADMPLPVPARFVPDTQQIEVNENLVASRAEAAQYLVEEVLHGIDSVGPTRTLSAASGRFDPRIGKVGVEIRRHLEDEGPLTEFLRYPMDDYRLTLSETKAELFARLGVVYLGDPLLVRDQFPAAYEVFHEIFRLDTQTAPGGDEAVFGRVWNPLPVRRESSGDSQIRGQHRPGRQPDAGDSRLAGSGRGLAGGRGLAELRHAAASALGVDRRGAPVQFGRLRLRQSEFALSAAFTRDAEKITDSLRARLKQLGIADKVALRLRDRIQAVADGTATEADGRYLNRVIEISLGAPGPGRKGLPGSARRGLLTAPAGPLASAAFW